MDQLSFLADLRKNMVRRNMDRWMAVTGPRRKGKSTLAQNNAKMVYPDFDYQEHVSFTADHLIEVALEAPKGAALILDEPISGLLSMDATTSENKDLYKAATIIGTRNLFVQCLAPSLKRFTKAMIEDYMPLENHVVNRGYAQLRRIADERTNTILHQPQVLDEFDFPRIPRKQEIGYEKLKDEFIQNHRDGGAFEQRRQAEKAMARKAATVLRRYGVLEPVDVDAS